MFLSPDELHTLTGYKRYSEQRKWLDRYAIPYTVAVSGRPVILRTHLEQRTIRTDGPKAYPRIRLAAKTS